MPSRTVPVLHYFLIDLAGSVVRFPVWWYTSGFLGLLGWIRRELAFRWKSYGFVLWMQSFFVPMYGQYDWTGRLVSIFMRLAILIGRLIALVIEAAVYLAIALFWLAALPLIVFMLLSNFVQATLFYA